MTRNRDRTVAGAALLATVRGLRARAVPLVDAATIRDGATGATVADEGPPDRDAAETTLEARVTMPLRGRRGEVNGALRDDCPRPKRRARSAR